MPIIPKECSNFTISTEKTIKLHSNSDTKYVFQCFFFFLNNQRSYLSTSFHFYNKSRHPGFIFMLGLLRIMNIQNPITFNNI